MATGTISVTDCGRLDITNDQSIIDWFEDKVTPGPRIRGMFNNCEQFDFYLPTQYEISATVTAPCSDNQVDGNGFNRFGILYTLTGITTADIQTITPQIILSDSSLVGSVSITQNSTLVYTIKYLGQGEAVHIRFTILDIKGYTHYVDSVVYISFHGQTTCPPSALNNATYYTPPNLPCGVEYDSGTDVLSLYANLFNDSCTCEVTGPCNPLTIPFLDANRFDAFVSLTPTTSLGSVWLVWSVPFTPYTNLANQSVKITTASLATINPTSVTTNYTTNTYNYTFDITSIVPAVTTVHPEVIKITIDNDNTVNNGFYHKYDREITVNVQSDRTLWTNGGGSAFVTNTSQAQLNIIRGYDCPSETPIGCSLVDGVYSIFVNGSQYCVFSFCSGELQCAVLNNYLECDNDKPLIVFNMLGLANQLSGVNTCTYTCLDMSLMYEKLLYELSTACSSSTRICAPINTTKPKSDCGCNK